MSTLVLSRNKVSEWTISEVERSWVIPIGIRCLEDRLRPTCHQFLAALEAVVVDNLLIVHPAATIPVSHHFDLMLTKRGWQLCLVLLEEADLGTEALEVDLVVVPPIHMHSVKIETKRSRRHSP